MTSSAIAGLVASLLPEWRIFEHAVVDPVRIQNALLLRILRVNGQTEYGRQHAFADIRSMEAFRRNVPIVTADAMLPLIERMACGETSVLVADQPIVFNQTSGTTGQPKLIPLTRRNWNNSARALRRWLYRVISDHPDAMKHGLLIPAGSTIESFTPSGIPRGSASGMFCRALPSVMQRQSALPPRLSEIADYACRYYLMARFCFGRDISFIATPNPTTLLQIAAVADKHRESIIRAVHDGALGAPDIEDRIPAPLLRSFRKFVTPDPGRARVLEAAVAVRGALTPSDSWNRLRLIGCWLGGTVGVQAEKLASVYGADIPLRDLGYLASEGWFSIPMHDGDAAGALEICGNVFEFVPEDETTSSSSTTGLRCDEVEVGRRYRVIVTNWNGLYRYDMGDVVEVRGFYRRVPLIAFVRKSGDMLNITGEKLHVNHWLAAFDAVRTACGAAPVAWRAVPDLVRNRYQLLLRFLSDPAPDFIRQTLIPALDRGLCDVNIEYAQKRQSGRLHPPCVHLMAESWETDVRRHSPTAGKRDVQFKWKLIAAELSEPDSRNIRSTIEP